MNTIEQNGETYSQIAGAGAYYISRNGAVFSTQVGRPLKPARTTTPTGKPSYLQCWISFDDGTQRWQKVHRLVALAFVPNPDQKSSVNHKDGDKLNNAPENLEWMTHRENIQHAHALGLCPPKRGNEHYNFGKAMSADTRAKCSEAKKGENHPKFAGWFITPAGRYASANEAANENGIGAKALKRKCMAGEGNWSFVPKSAA